MSRTPTSDPVDLQFAFLLLDPKDRATTLNERLRTAREKCSYSQEDAAALLHISREMVSYWESGTKIPNEAQIDLLGRFYRDDWLRGYAEARRFVNNEKRRREKISEIEA